jgi:membrane-bound ClpP family serine protease
MLTLGAILLAVFVVPSPWGWVLVAVTAVVDLAETVVMIWWSKRRKHAVGLETLVGTTAVVASRLAPAGKVRVSGELWGARSSTSPLEPGQAVVITAVEGLTLVVDPVSGDGS